MGLVTHPVERDFAAYAEQRLSAARRAQVEAHLAQCPACRAAAEETLALVDALQAMPAALRQGPQRLPAWAGVWARVQRPAPPRLPRAAPRLSFYVSLLAVAFSAATLLPGAFGIHPAMTAGVVATPVTHTTQVALTPRLTNQPARAATTAQAALVFNTAVGAVATPAGPATAPTPGPSR
jgi:anti-sigma factor RsiW